MVTNLNFIRVNVPLSENYDTSYVLTQYHGIHTVI